MAAVYKNRLWRFSVGSDRKIHRNRYNGIDWSRWAINPAAA
jgi:hypothetical protein